MSLHIGIEAVGIRHCVAVASDSQGEVIYATRRLSEPMILHSTDRSLLRARLFSVLSDVANGARVSLNDLANSSICIGIAGAALPSELIELREEFDRLDIAVRDFRCVADTDIVLLSHLRSVSGSAIVCGSGSSVLISRDGECTHGWGWGPAIGESGSGYWIGRQAISSIAREWARRLPKTSLWSEIDAWLKSQSSSPYEDIRLLSIRWIEYVEHHADKRAHPDLRPLFLAFINQASLEHHHAWRSMVSYLAVPVLLASSKGDAELAP